MREHYDARARATEVRAPFACCIVCGVLCVYVFLVFVLSVSRRARAGACSTNTRGALHFVVRRRGVCVRVSFARGASSMARRDGTLLHCVWRLLGAYARNKHVV